MRAGRPAAADSRASAVAGRVLHPAAAAPARSPNAPVEITRDLALAVPLDEPLTRQGYKRRLRHPHGEGRARPV
ncbi:MULTISPECIES: hypothetical protein [unclassified Streptomyces]|uniref:hypothetical protein n=1 Tax=unclassified Streptomyces TaxID=2593676 RepID=UPI00035E1B84|nr:MULTISPECIES: hypothetical protein [unclassified Streptomyces]MYX39234.1 hypothetical protein [Streptomyces sp. SID8377]